MPEGEAPIRHMRGVRPKATLRRILPKIPCFFHFFKQSPAQLREALFAPDILSLTMVHRGNTREPKRIRQIRVSSIEEKWRRHKNKRRIWQRYMKKLALQREAV